MRQESIDKYLHAYKAVNELSQSEKISLTKARNRLGFDKNVYHKGKALADKELQPSGLPVTARKRRTKPAPPQTITVPVNEQVCVILGQADIVKSILSMIGGAA